MKHRQRGALRIGCIVPLLTIAMLWGGGQGLYTALTNRQPAVLTYDEYVRTKPHATWLELRDCVLALPEASYRASRVSKEVKEVFIPLHSATGKDPDDKIHVLLATNDKDTLDLVEEMNKTTDTAGAVKLLGSKGERLYPKRDVKGLVRFGIEAKEKDRDKLASLNESLASDFIIIDEGKEPELVVSVLLLLGGLILGGWMVLRRGGASTPPAQTTPPPIPPTAH